MAMKGKDSINPIENGDMYIDNERLLRGKRNQEWKRERRGLTPTDQLSAISATEKDGGSMIEV